MGCKVWAAWGRQGRRGRHGHRCGEYRAARNLHRLSGPNPLETHNPPYQPAWNPPVSAVVGTAPMMEMPSPPSTPMSTPGLWAARRASSTPGYTRVAPAIPTGGRLRDQLMQCKRRNTAKMSNACGVCSSVPLCDDTEWEWPGGGVFFFRCSSDHMRPGQQVAWWSDPAGAQLLPPSLQFFPKSFYRRPNLVVICASRRERVCVCVCQKLLGNGRWARVPVPEPRSTHSPLLRRSGQRVRFQSGVGKELSKGFGWEQ